MCYGGKLPAFLTSLLITFLPEYLVQLLPTVNLHYTFNLPPGILFKIPVNHLSPQPAEEIRYDVANYSYLLAIFFTEFL